MVRHVVMWKFKDEVKPEEKEALKKDMKNGLESLRGQIEGLLKLEFVDQPLDSSTHDMALVTMHESKEALSAYASHKEHVQVADTYIRPYTKDRVALDYQI